MISSCSSRADISAYMAGHKLSKFIMGTYVAGVRSADAKRRKDIAKRLGANCGTREILQSFFALAIECELPIGHSIEYIGTRQTLDGWNC